MIKADIIAAIVLMMVGLVMIFIIIPAQTSPGEKYGVPPATVPTAAMVVVTLMSGILLIQCLIQSRRRLDSRPSPMALRQWLHIGGYTALLFVGLAVIRYLHFIPGGILFLAALMIITGMRRPLTIVLVAVPVPILIYAGLWYGLRMPLP